MTFSARDSAVPLAQINVTPLVDVLLVLLVIVMITSPVLTHKVRLDFPGFGDSRAPADEVHLQIRADGSTYWNGAPVDEAMLSAQLAVVGRQDDQQRIVIDADDAASYQSITRILADARQHGVEKMGFNEP